MHGRLWGLAVVGALFFVLPASAHHSHANYDTKTFKQLEGTIKEVHWVNPHAWIYLEVRDDKGEPTIWVLEGGGPAALVRAGWKREDVKAGETIKVRCHPLRDGSSGCLLGFVTLKTGIEREFD